MGRAKQAWIEEEQRGYSYLDDDKYICADCFDDDGLKQYIAEHSEETECSYCGKKSDEKIAIQVNKLLDYIVPRIKKYWLDPVEAGMHFAAAEGGWFGEVIYTNELIYGQRIVDSDCEKLLEDLCKCLGDGAAWCKANLYQSDNDVRLISGWEYFCEHIKHRARYVFFKVSDADDFGCYDDIPPKYFLDALGNIINKLQLFTYVDTEANLYRIRFHELAICFKSSIDLGSPPRHVAFQANRMSPAGIPMFYASFDLDTAIQEVYEPTGKHKTYSYGIFRASRQLLCVDLTKIPEVPSIFDEQRGEFREEIVFLKSFLADFTAPVAKDKETKEHIDYVPTQVVTEYIRHCLFSGDENKKAIDGVIYPSSKNGKNSVVLFADQKNICDGCDFDEKQEMLYLEQVGIGKV